LACIVDSLERARLGRKKCGAAVIDLATFIDASSFGSLHNVNPIPVNFLRKHGQRVPAQSRQRCQARWIDGSL
jgi:hypothetical protein